MDNAAPPHGKTSGFSLIELMIAVAIVGILAAIAYPSYRQQVERGRRAEARTVLLEAAQFMQRYYGANDTYAGAVLPPALSRSPANGTQLYSIVLAAGANRSTYTLQAVPQGVMSNDKCGTMSIDSSGRKTVTGTASVAECWK